MQDFFKSVLFKILLVVMASLVGLLICEASIGNLVAPEQIIGMIQFASIILPNQNMNALVQQD